MKKLILSVIVAMFIGTTSTFAFVGNGNPIDDFSEASQELSELLNESHYYSEINEDVTVKVYLTVNDNHETVVIRVDSKDETVKDYIKNKLNYKKIASRQLQVGTNYSIKVMFKIH